MTVMSALACKAPRVSRIKVSTTEQCRASSAPQDAAGLLWEGAPCASFSQAKQETLRSPEGLAAASSQ
jgi:hypothetical protein